MEKPARSSTGEQPRSQRTKCEWPLYAKNQSRFTAALSSPRAEKFTCGATCSVSSQLDFNNLRPCCCSEGDLGSSGLLRSTLAQRGDPGRIVDRQMHQLSSSHSPGPHITATQDSSNWNAQVTSLPARVATCKSNYCFCSRAIAFANSGAGDSGARRAIISPLLPLKAPRSLPAQPPLPREPPTLHSPTPCRCAPFPPMALQARRRRL